MSSEVLERGNRLLLKSELVRLVKLAGGRPLCIRCAKPLLRLVLVGASSVAREARRSFCGGCIDYFGGEQNAALLSTAYWNPRRVEVPKGALS